ncbi:MAG: hypothetical protein ACOWWM_11845, partial [Desulfobacterales bacterium]
IPQHFIALVRVCQCVSSEQSERVAEKQVSTMKSMKFMKQKVSQKVYGYANQYSRETVKDLRTNDQPLNREP